MSDLVKTPKTGFLASMLILAWFVMTSTQFVCRASKVPFLIRYILSIIIIGVRIVDSYNYMDSTIPLLSKSKISNLQPSSVLLQLGLCRTCSETKCLANPWLIYMGIK